MALSQSSLLLNLLPASISSEPSTRLPPSTTISSLRHPSPLPAFSSASHNAGSSIFPSALQSLPLITLPRTSTTAQPVISASSSAHPRTITSQASGASLAPPAVSKTAASFLLSDKDASCFYDAWMADASPNSRSTTGRFGTLTGSRGAAQLKERSAQFLSDLRKASATAAVSTAFALSAGCCTPGAALALDQLPPPVPPASAEVVVSATSSAMSSLFNEDMMSQLEYIPSAPATSASTTPASLTRQVSLTSLGTPVRVVSPEAQEEAKAMLARQLEEQDRLRKEEERLCDAVLSPVKQGIAAPDSVSGRTRSVTWADCAGDFPADVMVPLSLSHSGSIGGSGGSNSGTIVAEPAVYVGPVGGGAAAASTAAMSGAAVGPIATTEVSFAGAAAASLTLETAAAAAIVGSTGGVSAKLAAILSQSLQHFGVGGVAGAVGAAAVYPLDTIKTRMQAQRQVKDEDDGEGGADGSSSGAGRSATSASQSPAAAAAAASDAAYRDEWDCFLRMVREEGPGALYSGLGAQLVGIAPEKAIKLTVNEVLLTLLESTIPGARLWVLEIIAGGGGGFCQVVFTNPVEIVKVRMQARRKTTTTSAMSDSSSDSEAEIGAGGAAGQQAQEKGKTSWQVVQELGLRGLYSGSSVTLARDVPSTALFFACYAALKQVMPDQTFLDGCLAAVPAAYLVTPMDVVKTRMQMEPEEGEVVPANAWACAQGIVAEEGLGALFKGGVARVLRMSPQFGITLMLYDMLLH